MEKQIHVNSYMRKDGTVVKEHFRTIDARDYGILPTIRESNKIPEFDKPKREHSKDKFPYEHPEIDLDHNIVLEGGVSVDVDLPTEGGTGEGLSSVAGIVLEILPLALQIYQAISDGGGQAAAYLQPEFNAKIKLLDNQVKQMKTDIDTKVEKLTNIKDKGEYTKLYNPLQKDWQAYQSAKNIVNRIKAYSNNGDFQSVVNEINNLTSNNQKQIISDILQPNVKLKNSIPNFSNNTQKIPIKMTSNEKLNQIANPMNPNPQTIENIYNGLSTTVKNLKPKIDKFINVAKHSKGPLYLLNNYANYHRPEARQFMNLSLNLPEDTYSNSEYSMIQPIFNEKLNEYLHKIGTDLQVTKNMRGIVFDKSSPISQKLSNFEQLQNDIRAKYNQDAKFISGLGISTDTNLQYSVGHFTILNPRIENGIFKGELFDIYDFDKLNREQFEKLITYLFNNGAYYLQKWHRLKNYYFFIPIEFEWKI